MLGKKPQSRLITGLDIGSTAIRLVVGKQQMGVNNRSDLQIVGLVEVPSEGVHKGVVTSIEEAVSSISSGLEKIERLIGIPVEHAWVGISGPHIRSQESKGVVAVAKPDGEIGHEDMERAIEASRAIATPLNYEVLHVIPRRYAVDGQTGIKDPAGMTGIRLEVDTQIIQGSSSHINNQTRSIYRTGIDIDDLVLGILAVGEAVVTPRQKELGVGVVNIGGSTTSLVVYEEGEIIQVAVLPLGSEHVTNDLAIGLKSPIEVAERVKIEFGDCVTTGLSRKEKIDLLSVGAGTSEEVEKKYIAEIVGARLEEILEKIDQELGKVGRRRLLPAGMVYTGGGAKISGLVELSKEVLGLPASLGYPLGLQGMSDRVSDLSFTTAVGLVKWGGQIQPDGRHGHGSSFKGMERASRQVRQWFKSLVP
ncbi:MAG TPA: cell division protein FtsA [Patescibacteria group bacterium]|nr:cell division protein FtsA [Patescibacteria group bacterium]